VTSTGGVRELLTSSWALNQERKYDALARLLRPVPDDTLGSEPGLAFLLADVLRRLGEGGAALEVLLRTAPAFDRRGNDRLHRRRLQLLGTLHFEQGRNADAATVWGRQLSDSATEEDEEFIARANNNLGILATLRASWAESLAYYGRAVASYQRLGYTRGLGQSHHNLGLTYRAMDRLAAAESHFSKAIRYARTDSPDEVARSELEQGLLSLLAGDPGLARANALRALGRYRDFGDRAGEGEAERVLGLIELADGRSEEAGTYLDAAERTAAEVGAPLLAAETLEARAALLFSGGRKGEAEEAESQAEAVFEKLKAVLWGRHIRWRSRQLAGLEANGPDSAAPPETDA